MTAGNEMRVSDTERDAAAAELQEHFASGRLNQEELDERLTAAFAAKTRADLNALFTDLPSSGRWSASGTSGQSSASAPSGRKSGASGPFGADGSFGAQGPFGPGGPFGPQGPFGPGGPFGPRGPFGPGMMRTDVSGSDDSGQWRDRGGWRGSAGRGFGRLVFSSVLMAVLFVVGILGAFGIGSPRPFGIVLILAAFALLRRLLFVIFGRRRRGRGGPRRRR
ncbi:MAG TPA: DUF1707 domain-containing protein [Trebonia sp.]